jgi:hypothetical protein
MAVVQKAHILTAIALERARHRAEPSSRLEIEWHLSLMILLRSYLQLLNGAGAGALIRWRDIRNVEVLMEILNETEPHNVKFAYTLPLRAHVQLLPGTMTEKNKLVFYPRVSGKQLALNQHNYLLEEVGLNNLENLEAQQRIVG